MTPSTKPVTRLTSAYVRERGHRAIVATIHGSIIELRPHGLRSRETVDIEALYYMAVKARVLAAKAERAKAKKAKRAQRGKR